MHTNERTIKQFACNNDWTLNAILHWLLNNDAMTIYFDTVHVSLTADADPNVKNANKVG